MSSEPSGNAAGATREHAAPGPLARLVLAIRLAASFLTILPVAPRRAAAERTVAASFAFFPLVGFALGAILAGEDRLLAPIFGPVLRALLVVASLTLVTGGLHLDALADTADALGGGADANRALEILRDSRIGSFGAIAIFFTLALKCATLAELAAPRRALALYAAPGVARWVMVGVTYKLDYLREQGAGSVLLGGADSRKLLVATAIVLIALAPFASAPVLGAACAGVAVAAVMRWFYRRWLGGATGDLIGAAGEIAEMAVLIAVALAPLRA